MTTNFVAANIRPTKIRLEAMGACQLKCPACPTASGEIRPNIASGYLRADNFRKLLDENPSIQHVELSNYGEIFLNPQIVDIMRHAHEKGVKLTAENGVNLNTMKEEVLEGLVKYKFHSMTCSVDGASNETYSIYRVKGDFDTVMGNIKKINEYKKKYNSKYPIMTWQYIVFGHNEHELPKARAMSEELGLEFKPKLNWDEDYSPIKNREFVELQIGKEATRSQYKEATGLDYSRKICHQLWYEPQINWDGKLLGCCRNFWGDFGDNVFEHGLVNAINNPKIKAARIALQGGPEGPEDLPCATCNIYQGMKADNNFITNAELVERDGLWERLYRFSKKNRQVYRAARFVYRASGGAQLRKWYQRRSGSSKDSTTHTTAASL